MKRGTYAMDLKKQIKLRVDEDTFEKITNLSDKQEKNKSSLLREIISNSLGKLQNNR